MPSQFSIQGAADFLQFLEFLTCKRLERYDVDRSRAWVVIEQLIENGYVSNKRLT